MALCDQVLYISSSCMMVHRDFTPKFIVSKRHTHADETQMYKMKYFPNRHNAGVVITQREFKMGMAMQV